MVTTGDKISNSVHTYKITAKLGSGSYGTVYSAIDQQRRRCAIKRSNDVRDKQLENEYQIYARLKEDSRNTSAMGVPRVYDFFHDNSHPTLVMDLLGSSLRSKARAQGGKLSIKSCLMAAAQLVERIAHIHEAGFLHRDIKPDNILTGRKGGRSRRMYIVDFGLGQNYRESSGCHYENRKEEFAGTVRYAGVNTLRGLRASRKDDLESLGYSLVELFRGELPWKRPRKCGEDEYREMVLECKKRLSTIDFGNGFPGMAHFMAYVRGLKFDDRPKYSFLKSCFQIGLSSIGEPDDGGFDWV